MGYPAASVKLKNGSDVFGHPKGLYVCFLTEFWERFSYYGMRALLIFYLTQHFLFSDGKSYQIYGAYTALVYIMPVIGGVIADRYLGARKAVILGAVLLVFGHIGMSFEGQQAKQFIEYNDGRYELLTEGRGDNIQRYLVLEGIKYPVSYNHSKFVTIKNIENGELLTSVDQIDSNSGAINYEITADRSGMFGTNSHEIFVYQGTRYPVERSGKSNKIIDYHGRQVAIVEHQDSYMEVDNLNGDLTMFPQKISQDKFFLYTERDAFFLNIFYLSLAFIICGCGFLKANISAIVGSLYEANDPRRDGGFTIFYMGINLGAFCAVLLCGWLGQVYGWAYGFGLAGIGMLVGLVIFLRGSKYLNESVDPPCRLILKRPVFANISLESTIYIGAALSVVAVWQLVQYHALVGQVLSGFGIIMACAILFYSLYCCNTIERQRLFVACVLIAFSIIFWALFEQAGSSLNLFADRSVDRVLLGKEIPASMFQSLNALFIILLAPLFSKLWAKLANRDLEPSTPAKFALAILQVGLGYLVLVYGARVGFAEQTAMIWLILIYLLHTTGELCLSPVGLSMITKLSVKKIVGMMMGTWFLAAAGASYIGGKIAELTGSDSHSGIGVNASSAAEKTIEIYQSVGIMAVCAAVLLLVLTPLIRKGMHGIQ